jgi:ketose-bisphosphate aldolase
MFAYEIRIGSGGMLRTVADLLHPAQDRGYGVGAFGVVDLETGGALLRAAQARRSPVILLVGEESECVLPYPLWIDTLKQMADDAPMPVAVALDHGTSLESCFRAIETGLTGVMYDGSHLPLPENIANSRHVSRRARARGIPVEAEIGRLPDSAHGGQQDLGAYLTDPDEAASFVKSTGVDALAVAIGTVHGLPIDLPCIDFDRLARIRAAVRVPLVLHGVSGTRPEDVKRCVEMGIQKFNVYSDLVKASAQRLQRSIANGEDIVDWLQAIWDGFRETAAFYMNLLGSAGQA